jgi:hypothetical protein
MKLAEGSVGSRDEAERYAQAVEVELSQYPRATENPSLNPSLPVQVLASDAKHLPLANRTKGAWYRQWRLVSLDGSTRKKRNGIVVRVIDYHLKNVADA